MVFCLFVFTLSEYFKRLAFTSGYFNQWHIKLLSCFFLRLGLPVQSVFQHCGYLSTSSLRQKGLLVFPLGPSTGPDSGRKVEPSRPGSSKIHWREGQKKPHLPLQPHNSPRCQPLQIGRRTELYQDFGVVSELVSLGKNLLRRPPFRRPISLVPVHSNVILGSLNVTLRKSQEQS